MTEKPPPHADYNALAKRYLDLWQEQVAKMSRDPGQLGQAAQAWSQMASSMMQNAKTPSSPSGPSPSQAPHDGKPQSASTSGGPAPAGAAHGDGGVDLADLLGRINVLEERVRALEAAQSSKSGAAKPAPGSSAANPGRRGRKKSGDISD